MGLDNIPHEYPCKTAGTAVMVKVKDKHGLPLLDSETQAHIEQVSCVDTQDAGGCPWKNALGDGELSKGSVLGMFGTDCWYRGKYGEYLISLLGLDGEYTFYGDNEDETHKSPESCIALANAMDEALGDNPEILDSNGEDVTVYARYASWYARWAGENAGGLTCWY